MGGRREETGRDGDEEKPENSRPLALGHGAPLAHDRHHLLLRYSQRNKVQIYHAQRYHPIIRVNVGGTYQEPQATAVIPIIKGTGER